MGDTKKGGCCSCKSDFKKEVKGLVDEVEGYTKKDHEKKEKELDKAFGKDEKKK